MSDEHLRMPASDLDLNMLLTNSSWGTSEVSEELKSTLNKYYMTLDDEGKEKISASSLWGLLSFYNRDIRLGNLSEKTGELFACRHYLQLAGDLLFAGYIEPFMISLSRAVTILETSQSKNGFLRQGMNTLTQRHISEEISPPKKEFFGGKKVQGEYHG